MNIFAVDDDPHTASSMLCDAHVPKMIVEGVQVLVQSLLNNGAPADLMPLTKTTQRPHRGGYPHHPVVKWAGETISNWKWLWMHTHGLCSEFRKRYGRMHFGETQLGQLASFYNDGYISSGERTPFARALNQSKGMNLDLLDTEKYSDVEAYREFYRRDKRSFAKWQRGRVAPDWWEVKA